MGLAVQQVRVLSNLAVSDGDLYAVASDCEAGLRGGTVKDAGAWMFRVLKNDHEGKG